MLSVVCHKVRDNFVNDCQQLVMGLSIFQTDLVLAAEVAGQVADVLMTPFGELSISSLEEIIKTCAGSFLAEDHRDDREEIRVLRLDKIFEYFLWRLWHRIIVVNESGVVSFEKLEGFGDAGHGGGSRTDNSFKFLERSHLTL
jgi:hypothetical protein